VISLLIATQFAATCFLVGLCWLIQQVNYPLMGRVSHAAFAEYERAHVERIFPVVAPLMLIELASGMLLPILGGEAFRSPVYLIALGLIGLIWQSTFLVQVPLHKRLERQFDAIDHARLIRSNWIRTMAWSLRGGLLLWIVAGALGTSQ